MQKNYKSYFKVYLLLWLSILICSTILFLNYANQRVYMFYFLTTLLFAMIINAFEGHRITNYLQENNNLQYMKNRSFKDVKGVYNNFSAFEFLISNSDLDDTIITRLKSNYKKTILLIFIIFFSHPIFFIIIKFSK